ncbi:hypothetical protein P3339_09590 [Microbulbifer sp. MLAF003]|uniref:hypothetical protein n=1 Tax=Microbulbifer sp. MLAF003 TaxID=3032582 RepID=UPI0024AE2F0E|nr:hypothetical protein [Microbulbifer sp. MLAF003]WHI52993.1 hypothetical protein P3339_09590 [Microbulbifer sp. MLAF003]
MGTNAARLMFVPKSRTPYTDYEDPALDPEVQQAIDKAEAAQADADAALADLDNIAADGVLHQNEKLIVIREYAQLQAEQVGIEAQADGAGLVIEKGNYSGNLAALTSYLGGLSPIWNDTAASTSISRTIWNANWEAVYSARQVLLNAIAQQAREAGMVGATLQFQWDGRPTGLLWPTNTNYAGGTKYSFNATAGQGFIHVLAYDAEGGGPRVGLNGVQVGIMSGPNDSTQWYSFPVTLQAGANEISIWANAADGGSYGGIVVTLGGSGDPEALLGVSAADAKAQAAANAAAEAKTDAAAALLDFSNIAADGKLHPTEKLTAVREYNQILAEQGDIEGQANSYGITTEKTNYSGAITALSSYLSGAGLGNTSTVTSIDRTTWKAKWQAVYSTRQKVLIKIDQIAGARADWEEIYGTNKPEEGATVGATVQERAQIRSMRNTFLEDFSDSNYSQYWTNFSGGYQNFYTSGYLTVGGGAARLTNHVSMYHAEKIPFDPSKLYRIETRVYMYAAGDADRTMYAGLAGYDNTGTACNATGADTMSSQHYVLAAGLNIVGQNWQKLVAYVKGNASGNAEYSGVRGANHIGNPAKLQNKVRFIAPIFYCNYPAKTGDTLIDYIKIDVVEVQDQRNLPMIQSGIASLPTSSALSGSDDGSTAKITIAAHSVQFGFGIVNYNSGSITGLSFSTKYYVYCDDPGTQGGAVTYYATTNIYQLAASTWRRGIGTITTPSNGGGTTVPRDPGALLQALGCAKVYLRTTAKAET